jgi:hypothetical protein
MKSLFNIFTILKQFLIDMILRIAQNIENLNLQNYYVNYQFKTIDGIHRFEMPIIFEVRDEFEANLLNNRIGSGLSSNFSLTHSNPIKINEHKKVSLLKEKAYLKDSELDYKIKFMQNLNDSKIKDVDLNSQDIKVKVISMKRPYRAKQTKNYPIGTIKDFFLMELLTNDLK